MLKNEMSLWKDYFNQIKEIGIDVTEHSYRTVFENLLNSISPDKNIKIIHEPKREKGFGAPDFRIEKHGSIIGYIETKNLDESLDKVLKSAQIKKYLLFVPNLILTNYAEFIFIKDSIVIERTSLFYLTDLENKKSQLKDENIKASQDLFDKFNMSDPLSIGDSRFLAVHLAQRAKITKEYILEIVKSEDTNSFSTKIHGIYNAFKETLIEDLTENEFADAYAQTVIYGFFLAFLQSRQRITIEDASNLIPSSFKVIKEFFNVINDYNMPTHVKWILNETINLINNIDLEGIYKSMSFKTGHHEKSKDPYLYFYETFLGEFDNEKKKSKGVYYTPFEVVDFITRSIDIVLKTQFNKSEGFADHSVTVLDFATGTGTFLVAIFELIFESIKDSKGRFKSLIKEHILKNFYGFEYLVAPYAVAHLKLSQLLSDYGYTLADNERFQVYLTNTLDDSKHIPNMLMPELSTEGKDANDIKTQRKILVITGNPPYNVKSKNNKAWIKELIDDYKPNDEKKLNIDDDYIKFIRYAHWKVENTSQGIIGIITNNSFLSGITHRKMRGKLFKDFDKIYILNLHGSSRVDETSDKGVDENVFDIMQGVSISIFVKNKKRESACKVFYFDLFGKRADKYRFLLEHNIKNVEWEELDIDNFNNDFKKTRWGKNRFSDNLNFFVPMKGFSLMKDYGEFWGVTEIFKEFNSGIETKRDFLTVQFTKEELKDVIGDFKKLNSDTIKKKYNIPQDNDGWSLHKAIDVLKNTNFEEDNINKFHYRPFDIQYIYYTEQQGFLGRPRYKIMKHFLKHENVGLLICRQQSRIGFYHTFVSENIVDKHCIGDQSFLFPLYLYQNTNSKNGQLYEDKTPNFTPEFQIFINKKYSFIPSPKDLLGYIYAVFCSPTFRKKYIELLKIDFPRVPFTDNENVFKNLSQLGSELIEHHLMKKSYPDNKIVYPIEGNDTVEKISYSETVNEHKGKIYINNTQFFDNITKEVWDFHIGGYQVLDKWLKSRKSRVLSYQEQVTFMQIVNILDFTIRQMEKIDIVFCNQ